MEITVKKINKNLKLNLNYEEKDYKLIDAKTCDDIRRLYFLEANKNKDVPDIEVITWDDYYCAVAINGKDSKTRRYQRGEVLDEKIEVEEKAKGLIKKLSKK